jgi:hypothetical protein
MVGCSLPVGCVRGVETSDCDNTSPGRPRLYHSVFILEAVEYKGNGLAGLVDGNPFTPGFGTSPVFLAGRDELVAQMSRAFGSTFDPHRTAWLRAARGTGKTILLNEIQDVALNAGWLVVQEDAQHGDLVARLGARIAALHPKPKRRRVRKAGVSTPVGGAELELSDGAVDDPLAQSLRDQLVRLLDDRDPAPNGVLITIDEVHNATRDELGVVGNAVQHLIRQDRPVALVMAGLPMATDPNERVATFLGRCTQPQLERLSDPTVRSALAHMAKLGGKRYSPAALDVAVGASAGYPYMMQLVGYWSWPTSGEELINLRHVTNALATCDRELASAVLIPIQRALSPGDVAYLKAMARDDGPSKTSVIARRLKQTIQYAGVYRQRLVDQGLIVATGHGSVDLVIPGHRAMLRSANYTAMTPVGHGLSVQGVEPTR